MTLHAWFLCTCCCSCLLQYHFICFMPFPAQVNYNFFLDPLLKPRLKMCCFFLFLQDFNCPHSNNNLSCQDCYVLLYPIFPHMGSDLPRLHHSAPYCPTQELPRKTSRNLSPPKANRPCAQFQDHIANTDELPSLPLMTMTMLTMTGNYHWDQRGILNS